MPYFYNKIREKNVKIIRKRKMHLQYCTVFLNISLNKWTWTVQIHVFKVQLYVHKLIEKNQNTFGDLIVLISSLISKQFVESYIYQ